MDPERIRPRRPGVGGGAGRSTMDPVQGPGAWQRPPAGHRRGRRHPAAAARPAVCAASRPRRSWRAATATRSYRSARHGSSARQIRDGRLFVAPDSGHDVLTRRPTARTRSPARLLSFDRDDRHGPSRRPTGGAPMTTLLALYRRPDGGPDGPGRPSSGATPRSTCRSWRARPACARRGSGVSVEALGERDAT